MQTQSKPAPNPEREELSRNAPRSVFGNYRAELSPGVSKFEELQCSTPSSGDDSAASRTRGLRLDTSLQAAIDRALARAFIYRCLARAFEHPSEENRAGITDGELHHLLLTSVNALDPQNEAGLSGNAQIWIARLKRGGLDALQAEYNATFGHAARGLCPPNEIDYADLKADPLFQPHRLADLAAFYLAFGMEVCPDAAERHDHICLELEFMSVLAAREAYALEHQFDQGQLALGYDAQKAFLREHLGRWAPAFTRRLARQVNPDSPFAALANFTREFVASECSRFHLAIGNEDMALRPIDPAAESLCDKCGLASRFPGAMPICEES